MLSPCSSSPTLFPECCENQIMESFANTNHSLFEPNDVLPLENTTQELRGTAEGKDFTIIMPDLNERVRIHLDQIKLFVAQHTRLKLQLSVFHLLLYILAHHTHNSTLCINHLKLLHMGKLYGVQTLGDLQQPQALLQDICRQFTTFQLMYTLKLVSVPLALPVGDLVARTSNIVYPRPDGIVAVTYTDAMLRILRKSLRRKLSATSLDLPCAVQTMLHDSGTDVEDGEQSGKKLRSWKRMFRKIDAAPRLVRA